VDRRMRRAKTDALDAAALLSQLIRHHQGEERVWSVLRGPSEESEDGRRLHRELERLKKERTQHGKRLPGLLIAPGVRLDLKGDLREKLQSARRWDRTELPAELKSEIGREIARLELVRAQIRDLEDEQENRLRSQSTGPLEKVAHLTKLRGIATTSAWVFVM